MATIAIPSTVTRLTSRSRLPNFIPSPLNQPIKEIREALEPQTLTSDFLSVRGISGTIRRISRPSEASPKLNHISSATATAAANANANGKLILNSVVKSDATKSQTAIHQLWISAFPKLLGKYGFLNFETLIKHVKISQKLVQDLQILNSKLEKMSKNLETMMENGAGGLSKILQDKGLSYLNPINVVIISIMGTLGHLQKIHDNLSKLFDKKRIEDIEDGF